MMYIKLKKCHDGLSSMEGTFKLHLLVVEDGQCSRVCQMLIRDCTCAGRALTCADRQKSLSKAEVTNHYVDVEIKGKLLQQLPKYKFLSMSKIWNRGVT